MVRVNFRIYDRVENQQIFQFFKDIGYEQIGTNNKSIRVEDEIITTNVFIRNTTNGRYHIYFAFGKKFSGAIKYPQIKVFAHYDIKKVIKGKARHYVDRNEQRNLREMYRISKKLKAAHLGHLEYKDKNCAHATLDLKNKDKLFDLINQKYKKYEKGKYKKRINGAQYTLSIFEQERFIHLVCVYAKYINKGHGLIKPKAIEEINRIIQYIKDQQN